jgi:hypothetical protein
MNEPSNDYYLLVEISFSRGGSAPTVIRRTSLDEDVEVSSGVFLSDVSMQLELPTYGGTLDAQAFKLTLATSEQELLDLSSGRAFPATKVTVTERSVGVSTRTLVLGHGDLALATRNPGGREGRIRLTVEPDIAGLKNHRQGVPIQPQCWQLFTDPKTCQVVKLPDAIAIIDIQGAKLIAQGTVSETTYKRGYVEYRGDRIRVREALPTGAGVPAVFYLGQLPPKAWLQEIQANGSFSPSFYHGCLKTLDACVNDWNNVARFNGAGVGMPDRNPQFESG